jgi:hypothetical protein
MSLYPVTDEDVLRIENVFQYHAPIAGQPEKYEELRSLAKSLALRFINLCPISRERSLALTKLEEAIMWANASIARNEMEKENI